MKRLLALLFCATLVRCTPVHAAGESALYINPSTGAVTRPVTAATFRSANGIGTVTSINLTQPAAGITVSGGPITSSGSITLALANDLAALEALSGTNTIYYRSAADTWTAVTIGGNLSFSGGTLNGNAGTVTSVAMTVPSFLSVSGSPVTSSGTLAVTLSGTALPVANGGTGLTSGTSGGVPYFSASNTLASSAALAANRIVLGGGAGTAPATLGSLGTTTTVLHGNAAGAPTFGAVSLTADVSGILPAANGGAGAVSGILKSDGSGTVSAAAAGTDYLAPTGDGSGLTGLPWSEDFVWLREEFITGYSQFGAYAWESQSGTKGMATPENNHPGIVRMTTGASTNDDAKLYLGYYYPIRNLLDSTMVAQFVFRLNSTSAVSFRIGFSYDINAIEAGKGIWLRYDTTGTPDTNFFFCAKNSGTANDKEASGTATDSGVAADTNFHTVKIRRVSASSVAFSLDGGAETTISSNIPNDGIYVAPFYNVTTRTTAAKTADLDLFTLFMGVTR